MSQSLHLSGRKLVGRVLLVESDIDFGIELNSKLETSGLTCVLERDVASAESRFQSEIFHAVITDVYLNSENPNGLKLLEFIHPTGTPVLMMTSPAHLHIAKEAVNLGVSYILEKPFAVDEAISALSHIWEEPSGLHAILERFLDVHDLTPKEKEVARLLVKGLANKEIAAVEEITNRTIKSHLTNIFHKCGVSTRTELFNAIFPT